MLPVTNKVPRTARSRGLRRGSRPLAPLLLVIAALSSITLVSYHSWRAFLELEDPLVGGTQASSETRKALTGRPDSRNLWPLPTEAQKIYCDANFGSGWLRAWNATSRETCRAYASQEQSFLRCRTRVDAHMTQASAPHVLCDAGNLLLNPKDMHPATHPKHRPGYLQAPGKTYHRYMRGAFASTCDWPESSRNLSLFPKDHMRDIMESFVAPAEDVQVVRVEQKPTLLVTREIEEHANVFHTMTDLLNVYITLRMLRWDLHAPRQVILLDKHPQGPLDGLWPAVAAGGGASFLNGPAEGTSSGGEPLVRRVEDLGPGVVKLRRAAFVPPGYTSLLYAHLYENASCAFPTSLFKGFTAFMLEPLGLLQQKPSRFQGPLKVALVSRKAKGGKLVRGIANEDKLLEMLRGMQNLEPMLVDLASMSLQEQLQLMPHTDLLIGMHGAALAWTLLMPEHAGVIELWPQQEGIWRCYEHTSHWSGLLYRRWTAAAQRASSAATEVDIKAVKAMVLKMMPQLTRRRIAMKQQHGFHMGNGDENSFV